MNKTIFRLVTGAMVVAVLATSSIAVAATDDKKPRDPALKTEQTAPKTQPPAGEKAQGAAGDRIQNIDELTARILDMRNRNNVVALLDRLVANGKITQGDANKILKDWDDKYPNWQPIDPLARIMDMGNRDNVVALLDKLVTAGKITGDEKTQILAAWDALHPNWQPIDLVARIMEMGNRDNVVALLDRLAAAGKIDSTEKTQILAAWDAAHPNWHPINLLDRIIEMKNRNNVVAVLDRLVANDKITQGDANKILKDWDDAHPGWVLDVGALHDRVMQMQSHDRVVALLDKLVAGGRLNQGNANKILKDWEDLHANQPATTAKARNA